MAKVEIKNTIFVLKRYQLNNFCACKNTQNYREPAGR
ncbi:hypothetical protein EVA_02625 [gut metagenome]|uniref:Uncharacterized protein n=1 Tax=gut metagenome TaxID=749906 RepID=J9H5M4_9ZZZZ